MTDSTIIPHVIGTAAMLTMFFIVGSYYNGFYTNLHNEAYQAQLKQAADFLASNIVDLVTLSQLTEGDQFLVKVVETPTFIGERLYNISLVTMTPSYGDMEVIRVVTRIDALSIYATADLPWSVNSAIKIYTNEQSPRSDVAFKKNLLSDAAVSRAAQIKKSAAIVAWCLKKGGVITIGIGVMDRT